MTTLKEMLTEDLYNGSVRNIVIGEGSGLFHTLIHTASFGAFITDSSRRVVYSNPKLTAMTGYTSEEIRAMDLLSMLEVDDAYKISGEIHRPAKYGETPNYVVRMTRKDRKTVHCEIFGSSIHFEDLSSVFWNIIDRESREREKTEHAQRMKLESLGAVSAELAHEVRNMLGPIGGYISLAHATDSKERADPYLEKALHQFAKTQSILKRILDYSKRDSYVKLELNLNDVIEETLENFDSNEEYIVKKALGSRAMVSADPKALQQVLLNLLHNSVDAMPYGGEISLATEDVSTPEIISPYDIIPGGEYATMSVSDTGIGIEPENTPRIFHPFFTTKGEKGNGIGLAAVWNIVKNHGGYVDVSTESGKGTSFKIYFPTIK